MKKIVKTIRICTFVLTTLISYGKNRENDPDLHNSVDDNFDLPRKIKEIIRENDAMIS